MYRYRRFRCRRFCRYLGEVPDGSGAEGSGANVEKMKKHTRIVKLLGIVPEFILSQHLKKNDKECWVRAWR